MPTVVTLIKDGESSWGFQLTGGASFEMPLTVFEVQEGGEAEKAGLRLGDIILKINGMDTDMLTLEKAHEVINEAGNRIDMAITNLEDQEAEEKLRQELAQEEYEEEQQRVDVSQLSLRPPQPAPRPEFAQRRCWHPIVLDTSPPPIIEEKTGDEEAPHKKIVRNLRQAMDMKKIKNPSPEKPPIAKPPPPPNDDNVEDITNEEVSMADQLRSMKRQLEALSVLPAVLQQSLSIVSQNLSRMLPSEQELETENEEVMENDFDDDEYDVDTEPITDDLTEEYKHEYTTEDEVSGRGVTPEPNSEQLDSSRHEEIEEEESEPDPEPEPTPEELQKLDKLRKLKELNKAWPWGDNIKPVYKISDRYKVPHSEQFGKRILSIESKMTVRKPEVIE